jgi:endonuclease/exonuclease/phosphatase family metal-dependent hydrolase
MKVLTWNTWHDKHEIDERVLLLTKTIADGNYDTVFIQENTDYQNHTVAHHIAQTTGHHVTTGGDKEINSGRSGLAILTRQTPTWTRSGPLSAAGTGRLLSVEITHHGKTWHLACTHLTWGGDKEHVRLDEARNIERVAKERNADVTILAGDLNTLPDHDAIRHLTGKAASTHGDHTYWVDAWEASKQTGGATSCPANKYAHVTAAANGIDNALYLPDRRIDYIMARGWAYGKPGYPTEVHLVGTPGNEASDHTGVAATLLD